MEINNPDSNTLTLTGDSIERARITDYLLEMTFLDAVKVYEERTGLIVDRVEIKRHDGEWNVSLGIARG